ncbi:hypothetical protein NC653_008296 [Populus alba x Populus x berolinensis]|uniref:NADH:quinone oxidoreductase/Mrp antiporter transmembrane domain-containing protein n=2 Tax=Magnoliopsida TaxID=3398 RepID=A0AAD6R6B9_9ROSI|nr:hypothetical protein NC653_008296 [Populus alba x Populus x berolinensis]
MAIENESNQMVLFLNLSDLLLRKQEVEKIEKNRSFTTTDEGFLEKLRIIVAFLSVTSKIAASASATRIFDIPFYFSSNEWHLLLEILAILSMIVGNLIAITQTSMKRMLAYSSIGQIGYVIIGIIVGDSNGGYASMITYMLFYISMNLGTFACIVLFGLRTGTDNIRDYARLYMKDPFLALSLALCLLSLGGLPPLAGFFGKLHLFWCGWQAGLYFLTRETQNLVLKSVEFGRGSRNLGDLLYLMNNEWGVCFEIVRPGTTPESMSSTGITQGDFGTGCYVPKIKWVLSGRVNSIIGVCWHSSLPSLSPFRAYPKENPVLLGREYLNRTNRPVDIFASKQKN